MVWKVKFNRFLSANENPQRVDFRPSKLAQKTKNTHH